MYRDQRRRARRVQRHGGSLQPQHEGNPSDGRVEGSAADGIEAGGGSRDLFSAQDQSAVIVVADAGINSGAAAPEPIRVHSRVLQGPPARFQHQPLLRVQQLRFHGRNPEERSVEQVDLVEVGAEKARFVLHRGVREQLPDAPDIRAGNDLGDGVLTGLQQTPEGGKVRRAREPARHADDGDGLAGRRSLSVVAFRFGGSISRRNEGLVTHVLLQSVLRAIPRGGSVPRRRRGFHPHRQDVRVMVLLMAHRRGQVPQQP